MASAAIEITLPEAAVIEDEQSPTAEVEAAWPLSRVLGMIKGVHKRSRSPSHSRLSTAAEALPDMDHVNRKLSAALDEDDTVAGGASPVGAVAVERYMKEIQGAMQAVRTDIRPLVGYPTNMKKVEELEKFYLIMAKSPYFFINLHDPFSQREQPFRLHSLTQEKKVLEKLMRQWGVSAEDAWGYITTGGTEGALKGIHTGYHHLKKNFSKVRVLYSQAAHYCVPKAIDLINATGVTVPTSDDNSIDLSAFELTVKSLRDSGEADAVLVVPTLGTTFFGGVDDVHRIVDILKVNGFYREAKNCYIHMDAALHGGFWSNYHQVEASIPTIHLGKEIDSVNVSSHKWWGGPIGGVVLLHTAFWAQMDGKMIEYVNYVDLCITGSRSGYTPVLWNARMKQFDWTAEMRDCLANTEYLVNELHANGIDHCRQHINVLVPRPSTAVAERWQMMVVGDEAQILMMPHVSKKIVDEVVADFVNDSRKGNLAMTTKRIMNLSRKNDSEKTTGA